MASGQSSTLHFLVTRTFQTGFKSVEVFRDDDEALKAYEAAEAAAGLRYKLLGYTTDDVVLLGADSLATLLKTHGNWFENWKDKNA